MASFPVRLPAGTEVKAGDVMHYGDSKQVIVEKCKYDPGCCVGHIVESYEFYTREAQKEWGKNELSGQRLLAKFI